jgi:hypothetical protein
LAAATCSIVRELAVLIMYGIPTAAAAAADAASPSGCRMPCTPTGATSTGAVNDAPKTFVEIERFVASRSMRGTMRQRLSALRFAASVEHVPAEPKVYRNAAVGRGSGRVQRKV